MRKVAALAAAFALAGCTVGPRHVVPEVPLPQKFDQGTADASAQPVASRLWASLLRPASRWQRRAGRRCGN